MVKKIFLILLVLVVFGGGYLLYAELFFKETIFEKEVSAKYGDAPELVSDNLSLDGEIDYFFDDFCSYDENSLSLGQMEEPSGYELFGGKNLQSDDRNYGGERSLKFEIWDKDQASEIVLKKSFKESKDLFRWNHIAMYSAWMRVQKGESIASADLKIVSRDGSRTFIGAKNILSDEENKIKSDDVYENYLFPETLKGEVTGSNNWEDFQIVSGWNYVFWRADEYVESGVFDIRDVVGFEIVINLYDNYQSQMINLDNLRVSDGLQRKDNPLDGNWSPPNDMPQYGVFDVERTEAGRCFVRLMNVTQNQYPSNGDHGRMVTRRVLPEDFAARIVFRPKTHGASSDDNSYFRFLYDFDRDFDPGHDWFGVYISHEYESFGLKSIGVLERYFSQKAEPEIPTMLSESDFNMDMSKEYEIDLRVLGQKANAALYEKDGERLKKVASAAYKFKTPRDTQNKRPFAIETTGSYHLNIYSVEIVNLGDKI